MHGGWILLPLRVHVVNIVSIGTAHEVVLGRGCEASHGIPEEALLRLGEGSRVEWAGAHGHHCSQIVS